MEYRFKRDLKNSFMIIDARFGDSGYEKNILRYNDIDVLVPFHTVDINNVTQVWYDITGLLSLHDYLMQQGVTLEIMRKVLVYLKIAINEVERYLIDVNHLLIDVDTIFVVKNNNEWRLMFIYYPDNDDTSGMDNILEFFMSNAENDTTDFAFQLYDAAGRGTNIDGLIRMIDDEMSDEDIIPSKSYSSASDGSYDNNAGTFDEDEKRTDIFSDDDDFWAEKQAFHEMMEMDSSGESIIDKIKNYFANYFKRNEEDKQKSELSDVSKSSSLSDIFKGRKKEPTTEKIHMSQKWDRKNKKKNKDKEEEFEDFIFEPGQQIYEPTVLLRPQDTEKSSYELKYLGTKNKDDIMINKDEVLLGSSKEGNDSVIDSPVISRFHAKIIREGQTFYVQDLNSTNGTSVNGKLIGYRDKVPLNPNDEVMFADERYRFV